MTAGTSGRDGPCVSCGQTVGHNPLCDETGFDVRELAAMRVWLEQDGVAPDVLEYVNDREVVAEIAGRYDGGLAGWHAHSAGGRVEVGEVDRLVGEAAERCQPVDGVAAWDEPFDADFISAATEPKGSEARDVVDLIRQATDGFDSDQRHGFYVRAAAAALMVLEDSGASGDVDRVVRLSAASERRRGPSVGEMGGSFEGGPDSVDWLRDQRGDNDG